MIRASVHWLTILLVATVIGCGNPQADKLGSGGDPVAAEAHQAIFSPEVFGGIDYSAQMGDLTNARTLAQSPDFKAKVDAFANAGLPEEWSGREAAKNELVQALRDLTTAAESGGDLQAAIDKVKAANQKLTASAEPAA
jgi:hypothetical protein